MGTLAGLGRLTPMQVQLDAESERALVERCRKRDAQAFGKIVDAYQNRVHGYVRRFVRNGEEALDVTQEVFIKAFQAFERFDGRSSLRTWLFRIAHNLCIDRARKLDRSPSELHLEDADEQGHEYDLPDETWNPEHRMIQGELVQIVESAIASMSEKLRSVLLLHDAEDMAYEEIAELMDLPVGTVKSRLFLARNHIRTYVENYRQEGY